MTHHLNNDDITLTLDNGQTITFPLESATDVIRLTLVARKAGYAARREAKTAEREQRKAERAVKTAERKAKADAKRAESIKALETKLAALKTGATTKSKGKKAA